MNIKQEIRDYLQRSSLTPYALALKAGVHPSNLSRFLSGKRAGLSGKNVEKILSAIKTRRR